MFHIFVAVFKTGSRSQLDLTSNSSYTFNIVAGFDPNRLRVLLNKINFTVLPVTLKTLTASLGINNTVTLEWKVENENNISGYEIEKSSNGSYFTKVAFQNVYSSNSTSANYNWLDE